MKPVHLERRKSLRPPISRMLALFLPIIMLVACGSNTAPGLVSVRPSPSNTVSQPTNTPSSSPSDSHTPLGLNPLIVNAQQGNLLVQSYGGFQCPGTRVASSLLLKGQLVLASDQTIYSQDQIAQMRAYVGSSQYPFLQAGVAGLPVPPPSTLRLVIGGSMDPIPTQRQEKIMGPESACEAILSLTNTGNTPIQVPKVGVQLKANPQPNIYHYHIIDVCSLMPSDLPCAVPGGGGPGPCSTYNASIQLGPGEKNNTYSAVPNATGPGATGCGTLTIAPSMEVDLDITFSLAPNTSRNLIYSVEPVFTIVTAQGPQPLVFPQLISTLAFASIDHFSCYGLHGTTFTLEKSPTGWCV